MSFAVAIVGPAGSGKSTVARALAQRANAVYLDKDSLAGSLVEIALATSGNSSSDRESSSYYRSHIMPAEYASLFAVAGDNLRLGQPVIIDAPFAAYLSAPRFIAESVVQGNWPSTPVIVVRVLASEQTIKNRLVDRGLARDTAKLEDWNNFWSTWGSTYVAWEGVRVIDVMNDDAETDTDLDKVLAQIHAHAATQAKKIR